MGRVPGYVDGVNQVMRLWDQPCGATWQVYAESLLPAGKTAILQLLEFDLCDILRCIFRPAGLPIGTKRRPGRRGKGRFPGPLGIPEALCSRFMTDPEFTKRPVTNGVRMAWALDGVLQRGLFWFMIADVTNEFLYNWSTLIMRSEACRLQLGGSGSGQTGTGPAIGGNVWRQVAFPVNQQAMGSCSWIGNSAIACTSNRCEAGGYVVAKPGAFTPEGAQYQIRLTRDNIPIWTSELTGHDPTKPSEGLIIPPTKTQGATIALQMRCVSGIFEPFDILDGNIWVADTESPPAPEPYELPSPNDFLCFPNAVDALRDLG